MSDAQLEEIRKTQEAQRQDKIVSFLMFFKLNYVRYFLRIIVDLLD